MNYKEERKQYKKKHITRGGREILLTAKYTFQIGGKPEELLDICGCSYFFSPQKQT